MFTVAQCGGAGLFGKSTVITQCRFEGADTGTTFTNACWNPPVIEFTGSDYSTSTDQFKFGASSLESIGGNARMRFPMNRLHLLDGDFTIETWGLWTGMPFLSQQSLWGIEHPAFPPLNVISVINQTSNSWTKSLYAEARNGSQQYNWAGVGGPLVNGTWYHIALTRLNGRHDLWQDGVSLVNWTSTETWGENGDYFYFSEYIDGVSQMTGFQDNLRVTNGTAVYRATFTPPAQDY